MVFLGDSAHRENISRLEITGCLFHKDDFHRHGNAGVTGNVVYFFSYV